MLRCAVLCGAVLSCARSGHVMLQCSKCHAVLHCGMSCVDSAVLCWAGLGYAVLCCNVCCCHNGHCNRAEHGRARPSYAGLCLAGRQLHATNLTAMMQCKKFRVLSMGVSASKPADWCSNLSCMTASRRCASSAASLSSLSLSCCSAAESCSISWFFLSAKTQSR